VLVDRLRAVVALLLVAVALSGCSDGSPGPDQDDTVGTDDVIVDATGAVQKDEPPAKETVQTPAGAVAVNKGLLVGRVHDAANFSIAGASVAILGTEVHGKTTFQGTFRFDNLTPGAFDVRVEAAGFKAQENRVTIVAGKEAVLDVEMALKDGLDPGLAPHIHDYWGDDTEWTLMDAVVQLPTRVKAGKSPQNDGLRGNNGDNSWPFILPEQEQGRPATIWPGTKELRFTLSWGPEPENTVPNAVIHIQSPTMEARQELTPVTQSGGTVTYTLASTNETDLGHAGTTQWLFWMDINNSPAGSTTAFRPTLATDGIQVKIEIVKGDLVLEAAHRDFWAGADTLPIGDQERGCTPNTGVPPQESDQVGDQWVCPIWKDPDGKNVNIIPPGTKKVQVAFSWAHGSGPLPFTYSLTYRTAAQAAATTPASEYRDPKVLEEGTNSILYEIELQPGDADGFYQEKSAWGFKWYWDENPGYQTGYPVKFGLKVTAFKDPTYT
jgi:hypothetical protein